MTSDPCELSYLHNDVVIIIFSISHGCKRTCACFICTENTQKVKRQSVSGEDAGANLAIQKNEEEFR